MNVWIGTAGYSNSAWVGPFYPPRTPTRRMLAHYSRHFPLVELNFTFYRCPTPAMLARLADQTPAGFQFTVKLPRSLSHEQSVRELGAFRTAVNELHLQGRLAGWVARSPRSAHTSDPARLCLERLGRGLAGPGRAGESRPPSGAAPAGPGGREAQGTTLIAVDVIPCASSHAGT